MKGFRLPVSDPGPGYIGPIFGQLGKTVKSIYGIMQTACRGILII